MFNMVLWIATTLTYFFVYLFLVASMSKNPLWDSELSWRHLKRLSLIALLCFPFNFNDTIITVFGNAESKKDIYSLCSLYQRAGRNAFSAIGLFSYQEAGNNAAVLFGITSYQHSRTGFVIIFAGISGYQETLSEDDGDDAVIGIGCSLYQKSMKMTMVVAGISGYQEAHHDAFLLIGISGYQNSNYRSVLACGLSVYQRSSRATETYVGLVGYQKTPTQERWGGVWSCLVEKGEILTPNTPTTSEKKE